jgi:large subunit ribosomal protein L4
METKIFNHSGKEAGNLTLSEDVFGLRWSSDLVHQVVNAMLANKRAGTAHTKNRGEVSGGGRKPWKQKGTGRARHGSIRSPIWVGGGIAHGPRNEKNYKQKINSKMRVKALYTVLSKKYRDGEILFVEDVAFDAPKTEKAQAVVSALAKIKGFERLSGKKESAFVVLPKRDLPTQKSFRNIPSLEIGLAKDINPVDILNHKYLVVFGPKESLALIEKRGAKK